MKRITDWRVDELNSEQLDIYKEIINGPRGNVVGPIRVWLNNPNFAIICTGSWKICPVRE
jgi:hypothetical protein